MQNAKLASLVPCGKLYIVQHKTPFVAHNQSNSSSIVNLLRNKVEDPAVL